MADVTMDNTQASRSQRHLLSQLIWRPLVAHKSWLLMIVLALVVLALSQAVFLSIVGPFLKLLLGTQAETIALADMVPPSWLPYVQRLGNPVLARSEVVVGLPVALFVAGLAHAAATYVYTQYQQITALYVTKNFREQLFIAILRQPFLDIHQRSPGRWMSLIMNDVLYLQIRFSDILASFIKDSVLIVSCLIAIAWIHWPTAILLLIICPLTAWGMGRTGSRISHYASTWQKNLNTMASAILDTRLRLLFIRSQEGERREIEFFRRLNLHYFNTIKRSILMRSAFAPGVELLGFTVFAGLVWAIGQSWFRLDAAQLLQFFAALGLLLRPLRNFGEQLTLYAETRGALYENFAIFQRAATVTAPALMDKPLPDQVRVDLCDVRYPERALHLQYKNMELKAGKSIALIGPSGGGKSSLIKTLAGLIDPADWKAAVPWGQLVTHTSLVSQSPFLFQASIRENLTYGLAQPPGDEVLWQTLTAVNLADDVRGMAQGLDTTIAAVRSNVSGGQLQRLVIARSLLRQKTILLFDEATSALDPGTEEDIITRMQEICHQQGKIYLAITHRLEWLQRFDEIWFVDAGQIVWQGNYSQLHEDPRLKSFLSHLANQ